MTNSSYIIDTLVDPNTGKTTVSVTTYGAQGQVYQDKWISGAPPVPVPAAMTGVVSTAPSANLAQPDVVNEAAVAGVQLIAAVAAGTATPGVMPEPNPDPSEM